MRCSMKSIYKPLMDMIGELHPGVELAVTERVHEKNIWARQNEADREGR